MSHAGEGQPQHGRTQPATAKQEAADSGPVRVGTVSKARRVHRDEKVEKETSVATDAKRRQLDTATKATVTTTTQFSDSGVSEAAIVVVARTVNSSS